MPSAIVLAAAAALSGPVLSQALGQERQGWEERLRKAEPREGHEVAWKKANDRLVALLGRADSLELLRLDPDPVADTPEAQEGSFHGYKVVLRTSVAAAGERAGLVASLGRDLHWSALLMAGCFSPRHGVRAVVGGETVDLVICFECHRMRVYRGGALEIESVLVGSKWEAADRVLRRAEGGAKK